MPIYEYLCEDDHRSQTVRPIDNRNDPCFCARCGKPAKLTPSAPVLPSIQEIPKHYNDSLGCVVESRDHLKYIQRQRGCEDFDPSYLGNRPDDLTTLSTDGDGQGPIDTRRYWVGEGA